MSTTQCESTTVNQINQKLTDVHLTQSHEDKDSTKSGEVGTKSLSYSAERVIGRGSFGVVFVAKVAETNEMVAIKKVLQDKRFKNRELQIMRFLNHRNVVLMKHCFYSNGERPEELYLNLVLEYVPDTVYRFCRNYTKNKEFMPVIFVKLFTYQLFRCLNYLHSPQINVCHRDIKPQNLLVDPSTGVLKLCDFGSAKQLVQGEPNVSYICSRYYRAPELIFGAVNYGTQIDIWSAGCVFAEMLTGQPLFPGESSVDQLVEIIKVLGTPTKEDVEYMSKNYTDFKFPSIKPHPWSKIFRSHTPPAAIDLIIKLLRYAPLQRITPIESCCHSLFDELRDSSTRLPSGKPLPPLFDFSPEELKSVSVELKAKLLPPHMPQPVVTASSSSSQGDGSCSSHHSIGNSSGSHFITATATAATATSSESLTTTTTVGILSPLL